MGLAENSCRTTAPETLLFDIIKIARALQTHWLQLKHFHLQHRRPGVEQFERLFQSGVELKTAGIIQL